MHDKSLINGSDVVLRNNTATTAGGASYFNGETSPAVSTCDHCLALHNSAPSGPNNAGSVMHLVFAQPPPTEITSNKQVELTLQVGRRVDRELCCGTHLACAAGGGLLRLAGEDSLQLLRYHVPQSRPLSGPTAVHVSR